MDEISTNSVTRDIAALKAGKADAAFRLWERYFENLVQVAKQRLGTAARRIADEEDVALSVFDSLYKGVANGRFSRVADRNDLWILLLSLTRCKIVDQVRRDKAQKRGGGQVLAVSSLGVQGTNFDINEVIGHEPTPEFALLLEEEHQRLLSLLRNDQLRHVAVLRIEGYTHPEIAAELGVSIRAIERKVRLIRETWTKELSP